MVSEGESKPSVETGECEWSDRNPSAGAHFFYAHHDATLEINLEA